MDEPLKVLSLGSELPSNIGGCHDLISGLLGTIAELFKRVEKLENDNKKLGQENKELKERHYDFKISLGTVFNKQKITNSALEVPTAELLIAVKESHNANIDETSHNRDGKKQWIWSIASSTIVFFSIISNRGKKALKSLMGDYHHIVTSDRYVAYNYFDSNKRQICCSARRNFLNGGMNLSNQKSCEMNC